MSVDKQDGMSSAEKLLYLGQAVAGGPAAQVIEGLTHSGNQYEEAIKCLQTRYNQPRSVHKAYVKAILEAPKLKTGRAKNSGICTTHCCRIFVRLPQWIAHRTLVSSHR